MSTEIEQRIVEMQFDNKQFERNVSTTMSSLDRLKQSLNLTGAAKGLESVGTAARGINLSGLTGAAETVSLKFSGMYSAVDQIFRNLVSRAQYTGEKIISAFTIDPIKTGFAEYETQINAVQTILANTKSKGTTIDDVNSALDELNTYADKTIYNFTEMTRNIGTFTAAGVDLDKSVSSIKGIANLAAVSGANSQKASTAMYQLSQALAAGKVQLMDWNSVVNAGMGGELFQEALKRTAKNMGTDVDKLIKKYGSFRESLTKGEWLTAEVLTETLTQLSGAYTEADLLAKGYTKEQAKDILELAATAESAATDVKTFTQLMDTLKESAQSGWTQTWEILIGDFEEAKALFSEMSKIFGDMIGESAESRNEVLQGWKDAGGRADLIDGIRNLFDGVMNIVNIIKEAYRSVFSIRAFTVENLVDFTKAFKNLTAGFKEFVSGHSDQIKSTFEGIFSVLDIGWTIIKALAGGVVTLLGRFAGLGGSVLDATANIGKWLNGLRDTVKETDIFGKAIDKVVGFIGNVIDKLKGFGSFVKAAFQAPTVEAFFQILRSIWNVITKIGSRIGEIFAPLGKAVSDLFGNANIADLINDGLFGAVLVAVYKFVDNLNGPLGSIKDLFDGLAGEDGIIGGIKETLDSVRGCFEAYQNSLNAETIKKIATAIAILAASIFVISSIDGAKLDQSLGAITILFMELIGSLSVFSKMDFDSKGLVKGVAAINGLASALLVLSVAMKIMSTMDLNEMCIAISGVFGGITALVGALKSVSGIEDVGAAKAISSMAKSLLILAVALKIMGSMSLEQMGIALAGVVVGLASMTIAIKKLPADTEARVAGIFGFATALVVLSSALKIMGSMSLEQMGIALGGLAVSLAAMVIAIKKLPADTELKAGAMLGLATSLVIIAGALKLMSTMTADQLLTSLAAMGLALAELAVGLKYMNSSIAGAGALLIASGAIVILAGALKLISDMTIGEIAKGLITIAAAFAVFGIAGYLLTPVVPVLLGLAGAMALFGVATMAIGAGVAAVAAGFTALAAAGSVGATAFVAALSAIVVGLIDLIPTIVTHLGDMIVAFCDAIISVAPKLAETLLVVVAEVLAALATYTPQIVSSLLQFLIGILDALADNMPQLIVSAVNLIASFFKGVVDALKGLDTSTLLEGIAGVGFLSALMLALSAVATLVPGAMLGVIGMGLLIAELALVLAAVGALAQIPGLSWLIGEGGDLLQQIGTAIGQFVGGLVGGIAEGATSTLPQVGTNLSNFMTNLQPFITGMQGIDSSVIDSASALAGAILALTAADLLSGITSFFKGGSSLADFGTEIASFGTAMKDYSNEVAGINTEAITTSVKAAKDFVKMAGEIPSDGLFGTDGIDDFGKNIVTFGKKMKKYADEVAGIDASAISASVSAAKGLVSVAKQIPDDGTFGTDGIDDFGKNIVTFGKKMKKYSDEVSGISIGSINNSVSAVRSLIRVINSMTGMDSSGVDSFVSAIKDLSKVNINGVIDAFSASASKLANIGKDLFSSILEGAMSVGPDFVTVANTLIMNAIDAINSKGILFKVAGIETISKFINGILSGKPRVLRAFGMALADAISSINSYRSKFYSAGAYLVAGFANGISANRYKAVARAREMARAAANAARRELDEHSPSKVGYEIGDFFGIAFVNAIADNTKRAYNASADMANSAKTGLKSAFDKIGRIISGEVDVNPTIRPVLDLTNVRSGANAISGMLGLQPSVGVLANVGAVSSMMGRYSQNGGNDDIISAITDLGRKMGVSTGDTYNINGVNVGDDAEVVEAFKVITRAIQVGRRR